jgi:hypothetical protein
MTDIAGRLSNAADNLESEYGVSVTTKDIVSAHHGHNWAGSVDVPMSDAPDIEIDIYDQENIITLRVNQQDTRITASDRSADTAEGAMKELRSLIEDMVSDTDRLYGRPGHEHRLHNH